MQVVRQCISSSRAQVRKLLLDLAAAAVPTAGSAAQQRAGLTVLHTGAQGKDATVRAKAITALTSLVQPLWQQLLLQQSTPDDPAATPAAISSSGGGRPTKLTQSMIRLHSLLNPSARLPLGRPPHCGGIGPGSAVPNTSLAANDTLTPQTMPFRPVFALKPRPRLARRLWRASGQSEARPVRAHPTAARQHGALACCWDFSLPQS